MIISQEERILKQHQEKLCSFKQFVGTGEFDINEATTTFSSERVEISVSTTEGEEFVLYCDYHISMGIKSKKIDKNFLMYERFSSKGWISSYDNSKPFYTINCCVLYDNKEGEYVVSLDMNASIALEEFMPIFDPDDERGFDKGFKYLCTVRDFIGQDGDFFQFIDDKRVFVLTRKIHDENPIRILCSNELENQLKNGKKPQELLDYFISIFTNKHGQEYLRIIDKRFSKTESWWSDSAILFVIDVIMKNPHTYSFIGIPFEEKNFKKIPK